MKNKTMQLFLLIGLIIGTAGFVQAYKVSSIQAKIPFDFTVSGKSFKAGDYTVTFGLVSTSEKYFLLRTADGKDSIIVKATAKQPSEQTNNSVLVFNLDENSYALAEVSTPQISLELHKSESAKEKRIEVLLKGRNK